MEFFFFFRFNSFYLILSLSLAFFNMSFTVFQVLSNIHVVRATYNAKSPKTWSFSPRVGGGCCVCNLTTDTGLQTLCTQALQKRNCEKCEIQHVCMCMSVQGDRYLTHRLGWRLFSALQLHVA